MHARCSKYGPILLFPAIVILGACDRASITPTSPGASIKVEPALLTAEPANATPEVLPGPLCSVGRRFGVRVMVSISARSAIIARRLRFEFTDRQGKRTVPFAVASATPTAIPLPEALTLPGSPISLPGASPVAIPGSSSIDGLFIESDHSSTLPVFLGFGCGVPDDGDLLIVLETADLEGHAGMSQTRVHIG